MNLVPLPMAAFTALSVQDAPNLDPINVIFQDTAPGQGRVWVECYGETWSSWWGSMGTRTVREFVASCDPGYLAMNLIRGRSSRGKKADEAYLHRICVALLAALAAGE